MAADPLIFRGFLFQFNIVHGGSHHHRHKHFADADRHAGNDNPYIMGCFQGKNIIHPLSLLVLTFGWGALILLPLYIWELAVVGSFSVSLVAITSILYVAIFPSIVAYFCWNRGIEMIGANRTGLFMYFIPVFASVMAIFFLGETLHAYHGMGMALILAGMVIFNRKG